MKKHSTFKFLSLASIFALSACGYGLKEVYDGIPYNSSVFTDNYFNVWDKGINHNNMANSNITKTLNERILDKKEDLVFEYLEDANHEEDYKNFQQCEPNWFDYAYCWDKRDASVIGKKSYGPDVSLNKADNSFKQGVRSKLFDGQMFCNGDFQQARVQIGSSTSEYPGFGIQLGKECFSSSYFMCNFKCSTVTDKNQNLSNKLSTNLKLKIGFYLKNDNGYTYVPVSYVINDAPTNSGDDHSDYVEPAEKRYTGRIGHYVCFGFKLHDDNDTTNKYLDLSRLAGISFEYELLDVIETYQEAKKDEEGHEIKDENNNVIYETKTRPYVPPVGETMHHAVMLYEVSLPHSTWH